MRRFVLYDVLVRLCRALTRTPYPLHRHEPIRPFFIIGAGRSGTTLLRRILVASGQVHIPPETYVLSQVISHYRRNACMDWATLVNQCMALFELHPEFDTFQITLRPLLPKLYALPEHERSLAKMLDMFYTYHAEQTGMPTARWGDKTPINTFALDDIYEVFPQVQFIHLLRDGVDVVASCMQRGLAAQLEDAAGRWKKALEAVAAFQTKHPQSCFTVRYEALVQKPREVMAELCRWLDLPFQVDMLDKNDHLQQLGDMYYAHYTSSARKLSPHFVGQGRKQLTHEQKKRLQLMIGETLKQYGYRRADAD